MSNESISIGLVNEIAQEVTPDLTAPHVGSGSLTVYATPSMVVLVERTCATLIAPYLPEGQTSVGIEVHVRHLAPTPLGGTVRIRAEITEMDKNLITFHAKIWDEMELVGEAEHVRAIIDAERFLARVRAKSAQADFDI
jgi:fluoroacetyl-CoA thioesterase